MASHRPQMLLCPEPVSSNEQITLCYSRRSAAVISDGRTLAPMLAPMGQAASGQMIMTCGLGISRTTYAAALDMAADACRPCATVPG
jgi:hypothetical protein